MERTTEIAKLVSVLRRIAKQSQQVSWFGDDEPDTAYTIQQYNKVLARLTELDTTVTTVFDPLPEDATGTVVMMAARQLAAYYEDEVEPQANWHHIYDAAFDTESFKNFWRQSARDIEDLGEYLRDSVEGWAKTRKSHDKQGAQKQDGEH